MYAFKKKKTFFECSAQIHFVFWCSVWEILRWQLVWIWILWVLTPPDEKCDSKVKCGCHVYLRKTVTHRFDFMKTFVIPNEMFASMLIDTQFNWNCLHCVENWFFTIVILHYCKHSHAHYQIGRLLSLLLILCLHNARGCNSLCEKFFCWLKLFAKNSTCYNNPI